MQISVEQTQGLERRMTVELPAENFERAVQSRLRSLGRTARVAGFRPGKVPMRILERKFGNQVRREVIDEAVQSSLYEALVKEELRPAGAPQIQIQPLEPGQGPKYTATFEIYPQVELASLEGVKLEKPVAEVTEEDVDKTVEVIRKQRIQWEPVERAAREGDRVIMDFSGTLDGEPLAGGEGKEVPLVLGEGQFLPEFEDNLKEAAPGEDRTFAVRFPEDYRREELAGKTVDFRVHVKGVAQPLLPEVDDAFAESFGVREGGVERLRQEVRENMQRELDEVVAETVKRQVMDALVERHALSLPEVMVAEEVQRLVHQTRKAAGASEDMPLDPAMFRGQAERRVALGLIMSEIVREHQLKPDPQRVRERVERVAASYEKPQEVVSWYYTDKKRLSEVEAAVLEDQVVDWVLGRADVVEKQTSFDNLLRPQETGAA